MKDKPERNPSLVISIDLPIACSSIKFNPANNDVIACLAADGSEILCYKLVLLSEKYVMDMVECTPPVFAASSVTVQVSLSSSFSSLPPL